MNEDIPSENAQGFDQVACVCEAAARRAATGYILDGIEATVETLTASAVTGTCATRAVVMPRLRQLELVLDKSSNFREARAQLDAYSGGGWSVWALVPVSRLGEAHVAFAGIDYVQGWWQPEADQIKFTEPQIP